MSFNIIGTWWHMGEEDATVVYRRGFWRLFILYVVATLVLGLFWALLPRKWTVFILGLAAWNIFRFLIEGKRAIIFSPDSIKYRPPFGPPRIIRVSDISRISEGIILVSLSGCIQFVGGVNLFLKDGDAFGIPLDFPDREEILSRIKLAVSAANR